MPDKLEYKLCFVKNAWAFFTSVPLEKQWGDDWNDAPYEQNAGYPYEFHYVDTKSVVHEVLCVAWSCGEYFSPCDNYANSPFSVEHINLKRAVPWLVPATYSELTKEPIYAGTTLREFIAKIETARGEVFFPRALVETTELPKNATSLTTDFERDGHEYFVSTIPIERGRWETIIFCGRHFWEAWARRVDTYAEAVEDHNWAVKTWQPEER